MNEKHEKTAEKIYKIVMLIVLTSFITFMITSLSLYTYFTKNPAYTLITRDTSSTENADIDTYLDRIKSVIDKNYLWKEKIDEKKLKDGAVEGYVKGLGDKYTEYIPKQELKEFTENITGSFVGIGIYMIADEDSQKIVVYYPIPDSPAEKAGIKSGDVILRVDGKEYGYDDFDIIADNIKGEAGTKVKIVIERDGKEQEYEITREKIETNPISSKILKENIGYVKLPSFDTDSSKKLKEKLDDLISKGAKSLILDLRNNGGGIVDESTDIADLFLDKDKTIMTTKDNKEKEEITKSKTKKIYEMPLIVLTNENTASASEILTAALKDNERATIIGTKTYGKGVIQTVLTLLDGSGLKITTAEYFTPNGTEINEKGIKPNIEVKLPDSVKSIYAVKESDDTQLNRAIEELSK
ncbi:MAG: S41 family peptidase [Clostridia bacterium]|nr:S41 family peptidase [Clostridia bacterium]